VCFGRVIGCHITPSLHIGLFLLATVVSTASYAAPLKPVEIPTDDVQIEVDLRPEAASDTAFGCADCVSLAISNRDPGGRAMPLAIAIRSAHWDGTEDPVGNWNTPLAGLDVELEDGSIEFTSATAIAHTLDSIPKTRRHFERGLVLSGETLTVNLPRDPEQDRHRELVVRFIVIPRDAGVMIPVSEPDEWRTIYGPVTNEAYAKRQINGAGFGLSPATSDPTQTSDLQVLEARFVTDGEE